MRIAIFIVFFYVSVVRRSSVREKLNSNAVYLFVSHPITLVAFVLCFHTGVSVAAAEPVKVIIDAGIDDSMAISFALRSPAFDVHGITRVFGIATVFGDAHIGAVTANALTLAELSGRTFQSLEVICIGVDAERVLELFETTLS